MDPNQAIADINEVLLKLYDDVKLIGSGRARFVTVSKGCRGAVISVADDGQSWFVERWSSSTSANGDDTLAEEKVIPAREDAIEWIREWLNV